MIGLLACNKERIKVSGKIIHAEKMVLHLDEVDVYESIPADSALLSKTGKFSFVLKTEEAGFYQLRLRLIRSLYCFQFRVSISGSRQMRIIFYLPLPLTDLTDPSR